MTVRELVADVVKDLSEIKVPIGQMEEIGFPIARSIEGLKSCLEAWDEEERKKQEEIDNAPAIVEEEL